MRLFGLIGFPLGHSFSKRYFTEKFERARIADCRYELFPLKSIEEFPDLPVQQPELAGLNVTIPYKQAVIPYLHRLSAAATAIGAVNCIHIGPNGQLTGHNTDAVGFRQSLENKAGGRWATPATQALVLGNGGAAKAVFFVLQSLGNPDAGNEYHWERVPALISGLQEQNPDAPVLIVNTTPVGMAPHVEDCPPLPFELFNDQILVFDLVYNPEETVLLQRAALQGADTLNGLEMLYLQADAAWEIWNNT
jgi:shikimate dehydrogenase